jgi:hypothetical protein
MAGGRIMHDIHEQAYGLRSLCRDPLFDRTLEELGAQGGYAAIAAEKAEEFICILTGTNPANGRARFRFTRKGEYRIKNCRKVDLGCGYRIVCIQKDQRLVLMYIGTHDDCFRWIERHRMAEYDLDGVAKDAWVEVGADQSGKLPKGEQICDEGRFADTYEARIMDQIDDTVLRHVFSGLIERR